MNEIKAISYEQARTDFLKNELQKAENRIKFWQAKIKIAKNAIQEMEAHDNASNAGWECSFYKDALQALDAMPKWISVEDGLPDDDVEVLVSAVDKNKKPIIAMTSYTHNMHGFNIEGWRSPWQYFFWNYEITHWMPLPEPPKEDAHENT